MKREPFFSIAIPTFNRSKDLNIAIKFLLLQTFKDFEIVISDNASTDATHAVVSSYSDERIKYFRNKQTTEVMPNVKKSIERSCGKYILLHGDDDFIFNKNALFKIKKIISKTKAGYVRMNYLSLSVDKKHVFDYRASKAHVHSISIGPNQAPLKIIDYLIKADSSFLSGIVFKNNLPSSVHIIESELYSWFPIIYYSTQISGAYYVNTPYILAGWSQWRVRKDNSNPLYSLRDGKLTSENFFDFIKKKLNKAEYKKFRHDFLKRVYVNAFLSIKLFTGNKNMLQLAARLRFLEPKFKHELSFWLHFLTALLFPRISLNFIRKFYLSVYISRSNADSRYNIDKILKNSF